MNGDAVAVVLICGMLGLVCAPAILRRLARRYRWAKEAIEMWDEQFN